MRSPFTIRRSLVFLGVALLLGAAPVAVLAGSGAFGGALERQSARWTTTNVSTSSTSWRNVRGLSLTRCTLHQVTAMLSATVRGAPVRFRVIIDGVPEAPMRPRAARFTPHGTESFSYTFVGRTAPFEADDTHVFNVQWRSPSGRRVTLLSGALNLLFEQGTQGCP
ncbi:MAG: hypothetical protein ACRDM7_03005 [Thermoleophilaceae bacterium]